MGPNVLGSGLEAGVATGSRSGATAEGAYWSGHTGKKGQVKSFLPEQKRMAESRYVQNKKYLLISYCQYLQAQGAS